MTWNDAHFQRILFVDMRRWTNDDVREFIRHRGYPAKVEELLREHKVHGLGLLELVKDSKLLISALRLHPVRALGLINDVKDYENSGSNNIYI